MEQLIYNKWNDAEYLKLIIQEFESIEDYFSNSTSYNWIKIVELLESSAEDEPAKDYITELQKELLEPSKKIKIYYNLSLFKGEYYLDLTEKYLDTFSLKIADCKSKISKFTQSSETNSQIIKLLIEVEKILLLIEVFQQYYKSLVKRIKSRLKKSSKQITDYQFEESLKYFLETPNVVRERFDEFCFLINVKLCIIDEGYVCNEYYLNLLMKLSSTIKAEIDKPNGIGHTNIISKILIDKSDFLLYKILLRFAKDDDREYEIVQDKSIYNFSKEYFESIYEKGGSVFSYFQKFSKTNYDILFVSEPEDLITIEKGIQLNFKNGIVEEFYITNIHLLCKMYKKSLENTNIDILQNRIKFIDFIISKVKSAFIKSRNQTNLVNEFAFETTLQLLINTKFRIFNKLIHKEELDFDSLTKKWADLKSFYTQSEELLRKEDIYPFQIYMIFSDAIIECLKKVSDFISQTNLSESQSISNSIKLISDFVKSLLLDYHNANEQFNKMLLINNQTQLMPIYLSMTECFCIYEDIIELENGVKKRSVLNIFLDSSYILPSNYEYVKVNKEKQNFSFDKYHSLCIDLIHSYQESKIERIIETQSANFTKQFDEKIKDNQLNAIQLIGLYAGLITFVLGSVSIIPKFERSYTAILLFLFVFASSLSIFIALLRLLFNKDNEYIEISKIFYRINVEKNSAKEISKYAIFMIYSGLIFLTAIFLIYIYKDQNERGYQRTTEIRSNYYFTKSKDKKTDSLLLIKSDTSSSEFKFQIDANNHKDSTSNKK